MFQTSWQMLHDKRILYYFHPLHNVEWWYVLSQLYRRVRFKDNCYMDKIRLNALSHIARSNLFRFKRRCAVRRPWLKFSGMQFNEQLQSDNSSMRLGSAGGRPVFRYNWRTRIWLSQERDCVITWWYVASKIT